MVIGPEQAFCTNVGNDNKCNVINFNPSLPDGGLSQMKFIHFNDPEVKRDE